MALVMLWGAAGDPPFEAVRDELARRDVDYFLLEQRRTPEASLTWSTAQGLEGTLRLGSRQVALQDIGAVYVRPYETARILQANGHALQSKAIAHAAAFDEGLCAWLEATEALVVNDLEAMATNGSKPYQAELIRAHGLEIPATLVTTDPDAAREFISAHGSVVYKSISGVRSIVSRMNAEAMGRLDDVAWCPTQFQSHIPGTDYRVHVVGEEVFACAIVCDADDYRYAARSDEDVDLRPVELPADVAERCRALARGLRLLFAGIDLRRTADGRWYCFEVNPSPGFTYYEAFTGQPIAAAVARLLDG